jgi:hypothetical protein
VAGDIATVRLAFLCGGEKFNDETLDVKVGKAESPLFHKSFSFAAYA